MWSQFPYLAEREKDRGKVQKCACEYVHVKRSKKEYARTKLEAFGQIVQTLIVHQGGEKVSGENRTVFVKLRMTPQEKVELQARAKALDMNMSDYIRMVSARPPEVTRRQYDELIDRAIYEVHKIGVNINQIAKKYNENEYITPSERLLEKMDRVYELTAHLDSMLGKG